MSHQSQRLPPQYLPPAPTYPPAQAPIPPRRREPQHSPVVAPVLALLGLVLGGLLLFLTLPVNVAMAQELVPSQAGTASALMMGFAWATAGRLFFLHQ